MNVSEISYITGQASPCTTHFT